MFPTSAQIRAAHWELRTRNVIHPTRVITNQSFNRATGCEVYFKAEHEQKTGSFKPRGAFTKARSLLEPKGLITHSSGNHGQAVAYVGQLLDLPVTVVVPSTASSIKVAAMRSYGATVIFCDDSTDARVAKTAALIEETGFSLVPPYDDWEVIRGQGTVGIELLNQVPQATHVVIPVGGGGLISGMALALKALNPAVKIYGVETEAANDAYQSFQSKTLVKIAPPVTMADGIRSQCLGEKPWLVIQKYVDDMVTVSEAEVLETLAFLITRLKVWIEPTAAVAAAALFFKKIPSVEGQVVSTILCGGNAEWPPTSP